MPQEPPKRERTLYEIASSFFAVVVIVFAVAGMLATVLGDEGIGSAGFAVSAVFLLLGLGRLYLGLRRGDEGSVAPAADVGRARGAHSRIEGPRPRARASRARSQRR